MSAKRMATGALDNGEDRAVPEIYSNIGPNRNYQKTIGVTLAT